MKKLAAFVSLLCIINMLLLAGFVGFLLATGRLDKAKAQSISDLLRHEGSPEGLRGKVFTILSPATQSQSVATTSAPATRTALSGNEAPATAAERIDYVKNILEQERLALENETQFVREQHKLLDQRQEALTAAEAALAQKKKDFEQGLASTNTTNDNAGFEKSLTIFEQLKPKQIKDLLLVMSAEEVARYLAAMPADRTAKIIAEFKTSDEKTLLSAALDKIRGQKEASGTGAASANSAGSASLSASPGKAGT
jgi:hypothetical protein